MRTRRSGLLDARRKAAASAIQSESEKRLRAIVTLAQSEPGIAVTPDAFNMIPGLDVGNGTLDLRTGTLQPHGART